jgi:uncharacterized membrane protein (DUF4010 family)
MDHTQVAGKLLLALIIGAVIGIERESHDIPLAKTTNKRNPGIAGVRTFSLLTTLGAMAGLMLKDFFPIFIVISVSFIAILVSYYLTHTWITKDSGFTTELGIVFSYLIGILIAIEFFPMQFTLAFSVILILILSRKSDIQIFLQGIHREELHAFISYALIALAILPFLPNEAYSISNIPQLKNLAELFNWNLDKISNVEIINPFKLWFIVVAITGIDMLGHVLERVIGTKRGRIFASIVGGFISSTATTIALAQESKSAKNKSNYLVSAAIFANSASFFPLLLLIFLINNKFLLNAAPVLLSLIVSGLMMGLYFLKKKDNAQRKEMVKNIKVIKESEIFAIIPAMKFALLFLGVTLFTRTALEIFGNAGFLITSSLAALTNTDAVTINIANLTGKTLNTDTAVTALILMNAVNLIGKSIYSFIQGKRDFAIKFSIASVIMTIASLTGLLFI